MRAFTAATIAVALALGEIAAPAAAQIGGDSYQFIKAVKDRDVLAARGILDHPGSTVVNAKDADSGGTGLHMVTKDRDAGWMQFLLAEGADPNARDRAGDTPLIIAASQHFSDGAKLLLGFRAEVDGVNRNGETALIKAVQGRDTTLVRLLIENGANPDKTDNVAGQSARDYAKADRRSSMIARLLDDAKPGAAAAPQSAAGFRLTPKPAPAAPAAATAPPSR